MRGQARVRVSERLSVRVRVRVRGVKRDKGFVRVMRAGDGDRQGESEVLYLNFHSISAYLVHCGMTSLQLFRLFEACKLRSSSKEAWARSRP